MNINVIKIGKFLKSLNEAELIYLGHTLDFRNSIEQLIRKSNISKEDFCQKFHIPLTKYKDFVSGNFNYSTMHLATLNAWYMEIRTEQLKDEAPFQVAKPKA